MPITASPAAVTLGCWLENCRERENQKRSAGMFVPGNRVLPVVLFIAPASEPNKRPLLIRSLLSDLRYNIVE